MPDGECVDNTENGGLFKKKIEVLYIVHTKIFSLYKLYVYSGYKNFSLGHMYTADERITSSIIMWQNFYIHFTAKYICMLHVCSFYLLCCVDGAVFEQNSN